MDRKEIAFWVLLVLVFSLVIYLLFFTTTEGYSCMKSPLTYGVKFYGLEVNGYSCSCSKPEVNSFMITEDSIYSINPGDELYISIDDINRSSPDIFVRSGQENFSKVKKIPISKD